MFNLCSLFCDHEYHILTNKVNFWDFSDCISYKSLIYCPKCKSQKWVKEEKAQAIIRIQEIDKEYLERKMKKRNYECV